MNKTAEAATETSAADTDIGIASVAEIIAELRDGRMVILVDEEDRENEGDLLMAAEYVTPQAINFMVTHARGLVCLTLTEERCHQLNLPLMANHNGARFGTNFTQSIEAAQGVHTGISAADRAHTIQVAVARDAKPADLVQPGHIFPVQAVRGGVLIRAGHTEAGCDLTALAGLTPAAVICEVLKEDGSMARLPDLKQFARQHGLKIGTIADLIQYRSEHESMVERLGERMLATAWGEFRAVAYKDLASGAAHLALVHGDIQPGTETLVRVHIPTTLLDVLDNDPDSVATGHSWTVPNALRAIAAAPAGVLVMLDCGGNTQVMLEHLCTWTSEAHHEASGRHAPAERRFDMSTYGIGAQILRDLNAGHVRLLSKTKMPSMAGFHLTITGYDSGLDSPLARIISDDNPALPHA